MSYSPKRAKFAIDLSSNPDPVEPSAETPALQDQKTIPAEAKPLQAEATAALLQRLPAWPPQELAQEFAKRAEMKPAPRTGETLSVPFPVPADLAAPQPPAEEDIDPGQLSVVRYSPEGEVSLAPQIAVTFSHPMIAISSQGEASAQVPVQMTPNVEGSWRWLGTKTIVFESTDQRLPMATDYTVTIPKGTKSANGLSLYQDKSFTFSTPSLRYISLWPQGNSNPLNPLMLLSFDQAIDAQKLLPFIEVKADGKVQEFRLATDKELKESSHATSIMKDKPADRFLAIKPTNELPTDSTIEVIVKQGAISAEGNRTTDENQYSRFKTYGPFVIRGSRCGWSDELPPPGTPWNIRFSNDIDEDKFDHDKQIEVSPPLEDMRVRVTFHDSSSVTINGNSKGQTTYKVTFSEDMSDIYGQKLSGNRTVTFNMGSARPDIQGVGGIREVGGKMIILAPHEPRSYRFYTRNIPQVEASLYKVKIKDYQQFLAWSSEQQDWEVRYGHKKARRKSPGTKVFSKTISINGPQDEYIETRLDLTPALEDGLGHAVIHITAQIDKEQRSIIAWVQSTNIGLSTYADDQKLMAWATDLATGQPLAGARIHGKSADARGMVSIKKSSRLSKLLIAQSGDDVTFVDDLKHCFAWGQRDSLQWHAFSDRGIYRPGETANFKGWVRLMTSGPQGDIAPANPRFSSIEWHARDGGNRRIAEGECPLTPYGGFEFALELPQDINLGISVIYLNARPNTPDDDTAITFKLIGFAIQEFRRPEFEVSLHAEQSLNLIGTTCQVCATGKYYAGGHLNQAPIHWSVKASESDYAPPGWDEFTFGSWIPWWENQLNNGDDDKDKDDEGVYSTTDSQGQARLGIHLHSADASDPTPLSPISVRVSAAISDLNEQTWSASTSLLVHPSTLYVGLKPARTFVAAGQPLELELVVTDIDGKVKSGKEIALHTGLLVDEYRQGKFVEREEDVQEQTLISTERPLNVALEVKQGGQYRIYAEVMDDEGRRNRTTISLWVAGGQVRENSNLKQGTVELIPDNKEYKVGETAEVLVIAPFTPAQGIYTLNRTGFVKTERFEIKEGTYTIKVPITEELIPNVHLNVNLVGAQLRSGPNSAKDKENAKRPAYASGSINLSIPPYERTLALEVKPEQSSLQPGSETSLTLTLQDSQGDPISDSEVTIAVIDESVLALTGYRIADPIPSFYEQRRNIFERKDSRKHICLDNPEIARPHYDYDDYVLSSGRLRERACCLREVDYGSLLTTERGYKEGSSPSDSQQINLNMRADFNPQALLVTTAHTDANGRATVRYKLPDNLTRYRITALAADKNNKFGYGESSLTACLPIMVRPSLPRFLNFGDTLELPVLIQNQTDKQLTVDIAARAQNLSIIEPAGQSVVIPAQSRREVRFPAKAQQAGKAKVQFAVATGNCSDAAEVTLPVWTPCTAEAFATYGQIDKGAIKQPVKYPDEVWPQFGNLEITTSSTAVQELTDAFIYLQDYPFLCSEQLASRTLSALALKDVLVAFKAEGMPSEEELKQRLNTDISTLLKRQDSNGGFLLWDSSKEADPYTSLHATNALIYAMDAGYGQGNNIDEALENGLEYVSELEEHLQEDRYTSWSRCIIRSYAIEVQRHAGQLNIAQVKEIVNGFGEFNIAKAKDIVNEYGVDKMPFDAIGWVLPTLSQAAAQDSECADIVAKMRLRLNNSVAETAGAANFSEHYDDSNYLVLCSNRRTDGILLRALIVDQPQSDLIPKLVRGLLNHRKRGAWGNTQENAFILLALNDYFNTYEKVTPNFVANIWLGDTFAGQHAYQGRTTDYKETKVPMRWLADNHQSDLIMAKEG